MSCACRSSALRWFPSRRVAYAEGGGGLGLYRLSAGSGHHHVLHRVGRRPSPLPMMVRDFQRVVGIEAREQFQR
jgi:hypothetical protein